MLTLGDGSFYEGHLDAAGEISGAGFRRWASGATCVVSLCLGPHSYVIRIIYIRGHTGIRGSFCSANATAWCGGGAS